MSFNLPSITVAVPAYNHGKYILQALDSMLDSGVPEVEIIVCDDASEDETAEIAAAWGQRHQSKISRFKLLRHQRNAGLCQTLNDIVAAAGGELIHIIASDDYFLPNGLLMKTKVMAEHPEWQVAFCDGRAVGPEGETYVESLVDHSSLIPAQLLPETMKKELLYHWSPPVHQMTWRRRLFQQHGGPFAYDPTVFCEDYDSALWAASQNVLGYIPQVCQAYRCRSWPQTSNRNSIRECRDQAFVLAKHARQLPPALALEYQLLSRYFESLALGDLPQATLLLETHHASKAAYIAPLEDPGSTITGGIPEDPIRKLTSGFLRQEEVVSGLKKALKQAKQAAQEKESVIASLKSQLKQAQHLLRHHSVNPARAMRLWWNRRHLLP